MAPSKRTTATTGGGLRQRSTGSSFRASSKVITSRRWGWAPGSTRSSFRRSDQPAQLDPPDLAHVIARQGAEEADPEGRGTRQHAPQYRRQPAFVDGLLRLDRYPDLFVEVFVLHGEDAHAGYPE